MRSTMHESRGENLVNQCVVSLARPVYAFARDFLSRNLGDRSGAVTVQFEAGNESSRDRSPGNFGIVAC